MIASTVLSIVQKSVTTNLHNDSYDKQYCTLYQ